MRRPRLDEDAQEIVERLEDALALARRGELRSLYLAAYDVDGRGTQIAVTHSDDRAKRLDRVILLIDAVFPRGD